MIGGSQAQPGGDDLHRQLFGDLDQLEDDEDLPIDPGRPIDFATADTIGGQPPLQLRANREPDSPRLGAVEVMETDIDPVETGTNVTRKEAAFAVGLLTGKAPEAHGESMVGIEAFDATLREPITPAMLNHFIAHYLDYPEIGIPELKSPPHPPKAELLPRIQDALLAALKKQGFLTINRKQIGEMAVSLAELGIYPHFNPATKKVELYAENRAPAGVVIFQFSDFDWDSLDTYTLAQKGTGKFLWRGNKFPPQRKKLPEIDPDEGVHVANINDA